MSPRMRGARPDGEPPGWSSWSATTSLQPRASVDQPGPTTPCSADAPRPRADQRSPRIRRHRSAPRPARGSCSARRSACRPSATSSSRGSEGQVPVGRSFCPRSTGRATRLFLRCGLGVRPTAGGGRRHRVRFFSCTRRGLCARAGGVRVLCAIRDVGRAGIARGQRQTRGRPEARATRETSA